jgi:hypothetical protein
MGMIATHLTTYGQTAELIEAPALGEGISGEAQYA